MIPTGWQIREGRELVAMSRADLAKVAEVGVAGMQLPKVDPGSEASWR